MGANLSHAARQAAPDSGSEALHGAGSRDVGADPDRYYLSRSSGTAGAISAQFDRVYSPIRYAPADPRTFRADSAVAVLDGVRLMELDYSGPLAAEKQRPFDGFFFTLPTPAVAIMRSGPRTETISLAEACAMDCLASDAWTIPSAARFQTVIVDNDRIVRFFAEQLDRPVDHRMVLQQRQIPSPLVSVLSGLFGVARSGLQGSAPLIGSGLAARQFEEMLLNLILFGVEHDYAAALRGAAPLASSWQLRRATDYMRSHISVPISTADAARAANVSVRSLQLSFKAQLGMSPSAYLRSLRLERARADILAASGTLEEIAGRWGFASPRQFAISYRQAFGELPSETAQRR